ncbi:Hsp33 family molecular chaperone HslO [Hespellia stercorisuis]|uniref:33 kDa chaperonin n=1 Tax=Hespellia stercorisuis DSM 15480 TaxID=1121950 RepID=A0A1M6IHD5_9FIRM|nr:Hsp33 family molecular chaperone HslO [Hespellia stercorisuis]SHJ33814.1 molecular chaperone Hsp33 [Hespellia stercorisuis DSM 15480]
MADYIVRATAANAQIRAFAATTRDMVETAREHHNSSPIATAAVGRLMTAGAMMGTMMKNEQDMLTLQIKGDGPIGGVTVTADSRGNVKGYSVNPAVMLPAKNGKLDVGGAVGAGVLTVIKDMGLKEPYVGHSVLQTGEIAEDLTYYFATSEQVPSSVGLGVLMNKDNTVRRAGGFIVQVMPFVEDEVLDQLEKNIQNLHPVTTMLEECEASETIDKTENGYEAKAILEQVLAGLDVEYTDITPTQFCCNCSKDRIEKAIISIGKKDIQEMIDDGETIEVKCHFCNTAYHFTVEELSEILKKSK